MYYVAVVLVKNMSVYIVQIHMSLDSKMCTRSVNKFSNVVESKSENNGFLCKDEVQILYVVCICVPFVPHAPMLYITYDNRFSSFDSKPKLCI